MSTLHQRIYQLVAHIPQARVATYGQIAAMVGDCSPRVVGYAMASIPDHPPLPWHRVLNRRGQVSVRADGAPDCEQRWRLEAEGVVFDSGGRVNLMRYGWHGPSPSWLRQRNMRVTTPPWEQRPAL